MHQLPLLSNPSLRSQATRLPLLNSSLSSPSKLDAPPDSGCLGAHVPRQGCVLRLTPGAYPLDSLVLLRLLALLLDRVNLVRHEVEASQEVGRLRQRL
ncbi:hypothetical protein NL676_038757 [Syzygium grande]|nr:hypothetical protein NL676_038757 [Syzygium grande]